MDPLGDPLTTRPILTGWEFTMEPYPSGQFGFIDNPDRQFGNGSVWTRTRTRSDGPEPLLTLLNTFKSQARRIRLFAARPDGIEPAQRRNINANKDSVEQLNAFPYLKYSENIADSGSQPPPPHLLLRSETYPGAGAPLSDFIAGPWVRNALGCLETKLQNNPCYTYPTREEYKFIQCVVKEMGMKMYYDNMLKEGNTPQPLLSFTNGDGV